MNADSTSRRAALSSRAIEAKLASSAPAPSLATGGCTAGPPAFFTGVVGLEPGVVGLEGAMVDGSAFVSSFGISFWSCFPHFADWPLTAGTGTGPHGDHPISPAKTRTTGQTKPPTPLPHTLWPALRWDVCCQGMSPSPLTFPGFGAHQHPQMPASRTKSRRPRPLTIDGHKHYEVAKVLDFHCVDRRNYYLVAWKGYGSKHDSWVPADYMDRAQGKVGDFLRRQALQCEMRTELLRQIDRDGHPEPA